MMSGLGIFKNQIWVFLNFFLKKISNTIWLLYFK